MTNEQILAIQIKIQATYQTARNVTILRSKGEDCKGMCELAVDGKDVAAIKRIGAAILAEATTPDDVFDLAIKHGLIREAR